MRLNKLVVFAVVCAAMSLPGISQDTVKIGVITPLTGSQAAFGNAHKNGYQIALDQINAKGGVLGKKLELDVYDDQSKPDPALQGVSHLVDPVPASILLSLY